jgi:hypothetical protein
MVGSACSLKISAEPNCRGRAISELADDLISQVEDFAEFNGVKLVGFVVCDCFFFYAFRCGHQDWLSPHDCGRR